MFLLILVVLVALFVRYGAGTRTKVLLREVFRPALLLGAIGFIAGFVGPMIFMPGASLSFCASRSPMITESPPW